MILDKFFLKYEGGGRQIDLSSETTLKKPSLVRVKTDKKIVGNRILSRAGKVGKSRPRKYKKYWNVLDDQGYTKVIDFENAVEEWKESKSDYDHKTRQLPNPSIDNLLKSLVDLQISEKGCDANSTYEILRNQTCHPS